jgi:hypothetical protein
MDSRAVGRRSTNGRGAACVPGLAVGVAFTLVGLLIAVPTFGAVGACWTLTAGAVVTFYSIPPMEKARAETRKGEKGPGGKVE